MHANNETGALNDLAAIARAVRAVSVGVVFDSGAPPLLHTDAAQSAGKVPRLDEALRGHVGAATVVGHKMGAPKGVAALWLDASAPRLEPMLNGGGQESGARAGTEAVPMVVALGAAADVALAERETEAPRLERLRGLLLAELTAALAAIDVVPTPRGPADPARRLNHVLSIGLPGVDARALLAEVESDVAASAGSACHSGGVGSPVLAAMGLSGAEASCTLRLSVGRTTTEDDVVRAAAALAAGAARLLAR